MTSGTDGAAAPEGNARDALIKIGLIAAVVIGGWWFLFGRGDGGSTQVEDESTNVSGTFVSWEPVDDARGYALFTITNHGSEAATAECTIHVTNDFGNFGIDILSGERLAAGETKRLRLAMDVGEGSLLINEGEVRDC